MSVTPKVPIVNILALASLAYRTLPIPAAAGDALLDSEEPVVDWLAVLLVTEIQALLTNGLRQGYVVVRDELPYVRGRLRFDAPPWARPGLTSCEFADFLPDIPENRLCALWQRLLGRPVSDMGDYVTGMVVTRGAPAAGGR